MNHSFHAGKRALWAFCALPFALTPSLAGAAEVACLTRSEAKSLFGYALPQVIEGTGQRCAQALPANAFLRQHGPEMVARYSGHKDRYWPGARAAFLKLSSKQENQLGLSVDKLPDESLRPILDLTVSGLVAQAIPLESCEKIDLAVDLLSPLPPENTAGLIALLIDVTAKAKKAMPSPSGKTAATARLTICKD